MSPRVMVLSLLLLTGVQAQSSSTSAVSSPGVQIIRAGGSYTVMSGDTLYGIAQRLGTTTETLEALNGLSGPAISVGQVLKVPAGSKAPGSSGAAPASPAPTTPPPASARPAPPVVPVPKGAPTDSGATPVKGNIFEVNGVTVVAPFKVQMGDAFVLHLSGPQAASARVRFTSEVGEDVRQPAETLAPIGAAGEYVVFGRVVLGKSTPVVYTITVGNKTVRGSVPLVKGTVGQGSLVPLGLPKAISDKLVDPGRKSEEAVVERAYARRSPQAWNLPFVPAIDAAVIPGSFGQVRTYVAGGPVEYHYGADYPAPVGTRINAVNDGVVVMAGKYPVRGNVVAIDHGDGLISLYFHQSKLLVKVGDQVRRGQQIGMVGTTGLSTGPHLHLEMRVRGEATNPIDWVGLLYPKPR